MSHTKGHHKVDRLTTGRRHLRAGSVTVDELLVKQASPAPCSESSPVALEEVTAPLAVVPATHRRPEPRGAQLAKLAGIGVATAVLCGAVAVSTMVAHQRREVAQPSTRPTMRITGEQALFPDQLNNSIPAQGAPPATANVPPAPAAPPGHTETAATGSPATPRPVPSDNNGTRPSSGSATVRYAATDLELVREFYQNLPATPAAAVDLLSPALLHGDLGPFLQSWAAVREIDRLDLVQRADGVLATVRVRLADGSTLRLQQLLTVAESPRRIVGVQLLSAQRN